MDKAKGICNVVSGFDDGADLVWSAFKARIREFAETEIIIASQHCSVGRQYERVVNKNCGPGLCHPEHVRSRKERCTGCGKIE
jgi:hypothetical protein